MFSAFSYPQRLFSLIRSGIVVTPYTHVEESTPGAAPAVVQTGDQIPNRTFTETDEHRVRTPHACVTGPLTLHADQDLRGR